MFIEDEHTDVQDWNSLTLGRQHVSRRSSSVNWSCRLRFHSIRCYRRRCLHYPTPDTQDRRMTYRRHTPSVATSDVYRSESLLTTPRGRRVPISCTLDARWKTDRRRGQMRESCKTRRARGSATSPPKLPTALPAGK